MWRRGDGFGNFLARAEAAIDQLAINQALQRAFVICHVCGLASHWLFPSYTEPSQVFKNRRFKLWPRAALIDILNPQYKAPAHSLRRIKRCPRREGVAEMQIARGRWGEAGDESHVSFIPCERCDQCIAKTVEAYVVDHAVASARLMDFGALLRDELEGLPQRFSEAEFKVTAWACGA